MKADAHHFCITICAVSVSGGMEINMFEKKNYHGVKFGDNVKIGENVSIGKGTVIKSDCIIEDNVRIGENVYIDFRVIIRSNVEIQDGGTVGAYCILGEYLADFYDGREENVHPLCIGRNALIRSNSVIYGENQIGAYLQTGHHVTIREQSKIGNHVRIGTLSDIQGCCEIQDYVNIHSNVFISPRSVIKKYAWLFPHVVITNDPNPPSEEWMGVTISEFAVVAARAVILPGVVVGEGALVGSGAVVTKDVEKGMVAFGNPAKVKCSTDKIVNHITGKPVYPWQYTFERGMPWKGTGYEEWKANIKDVEV